MILHAAQLHIPKQGTTCSKCSCLRCCIMKRSNEFVEGEDGAKIVKYYCYKCNHSVWFCEECDNDNNLYVDRAGTNKHTRPHHSLKNQPMKEAMNDEFDENEVDFMNDAFFNDLPKEVNDLSFMDGLSK